MLISSPEKGSEAFAMSTGHLARQRSSSLGTRPSGRSTTPVTRNVDLDLEYQFEPCAATSSFFLYTQESSVICLHHDTLKVERRFERHREKILLLAVDNVSEHGAGRQVVSYDAAHIAIVWDLFTGDELARFIPYDTANAIRTAAWMKNGNIAFGTFQCGIWIPIINKKQETLKAQSFYSMSQQTSIILHVQYSTLSQRWRLLLIVKHTLLGTG